MIKLIGISTVSLLLAISGANAQQTAPGGTGVTGGGGRTEKESLPRQDPSRTGVSGTEGNPKAAATPGTGTSAENPGTGNAGSAAGTVTNPKGASTPGTGTSKDNPTSTTR